MASLMGVGRNDESNCQSVNIRWYFDSCLFESNLRRLLQLAHSDQPIGRCLLFQRIEHRLEKFPKFLGRREQLGEWEVGVTLQQLVCRVRFVLQCE